jgi:hypothetical protein
VQLVKVVKISSEPVRITRNKLLPGVPLQFGEITLDDKVLFKDEEFIMSTTEGARKVKVRNFGRFKCNEDPTAIIHTIITTLHDSKTVIRGCILSSIKRCSRRYILSIKRCSRGCSRDLNLKGRSRRTRGGTTLTGYTLITREVATLAGSAMDFARSGRGCSSSSSSNTRIITTEIVTVIRRHTTRAIIRIGFFTRDFRVAQTAINKVGGNFNSNHSGHVNKGMFTSTQGKDSERRSDFLRLQLQLLLVQ